MKKILFALFALAIITSCSKWKDDKVVYYSEDYKDADMNILGVHSSEIEALWVEFTATDKEYDRYVFSAKSDGQVYSETGMLSTDWATNLNFTPDNGDAYTGDWTSGKEKYNLTYELTDRTEVLNFVYKETHCKK